MGIKKKLGLGVASAALGVSLVGGGTWAAFNDVETRSANYAAGTLDLVAQDTTSTGINLSNLKPGDVFEKEYKLSNNGSLAIKDVLLKLGYSNFQDYVGPEDDTDIWGINPNGAEDYLKQFKINILAVGTEGGNGYGKSIIKDVNLWDFIQLTNNNIKPTDPDSYVNYDYVNPTDGRVNVITKMGDDERYHGLPVVPTDDDNLKFTIEFFEVDEKDERGVQLQNIYQGDSITLDFNFEARQWGGLNVAKEHVDANGVITKNKESHSEGDGTYVKPGEPGGGDNGGGDDNNTPDPITLVGEPTLTSVKRYSEGVIFKTHYIDATAKFVFSDGEVRYDTKTKVKASSSNSTEHITFSVDYKDKTYSKELKVQKPI